MTDVTRPGDGDSELAAPVDEPSGTDDEAVRTTTRPRPSNTVLLLGAVLVVVIAQLVMTWFVLSATTQVRDQYTAANGLQHCLIHAQLNENQTTDPSGTAYKTAVNNCLK
jgi:hypothetical protein